MLSSFVAWLSANFFWTEQFRCCWCCPLLLAKFSDHLKKHKVHTFCLFIHSLLQILRDLQTAEVWRREGRKGDVRKPVVGIGSSSPAWTTEPQCGVPVHILKHHDRLLLARLCLFLSLPPLFLCFLSVFLPLFLSLFLSCGSCITWLEFFSSMQQQADESGWAGSPLQPSCLHSPPSLCSCCQYTASPRGEANKKKICHPNPFFYFSSRVANPTCPLSKKGKC